ncbi:hypothetical protein [Brevibacillus agri]|uniref:hypothetical protein n=1 Tax=Brevibacillus agri TaxID=51101 RepID=UPI003D74EB92
MTDDFWKVQFDRVGNEPLSWLVQAMSLKRSGDILYKTLEKDIEKDRLGKVGDKVE